MEKKFDLDRFVNAQKVGYPLALSEMKAGRKRSHWIWYIFPQQKGLGHSYNSRYYGLDGIDEAKAFLNHHLLGARLREICQVLLEHDGQITVNDLMGSSIDVLKLKTSMKLFNEISPNEIFQDILDMYFDNADNTAT